MAQRPQENVPCHRTSQASAVRIDQCRFCTDLQRYGHWHSEPTPEELAEAPHALVDILDPALAYSVADFRRDALAEMEAITQRGNIPVLVGGTMMYYKSLVDGLSPLPQANAEIRAQIQADADAKGWSSIHQQLEAVDPTSATRIHPNDPQRLNRALEVYLITGKTMTD